ncbi:early nodulin-like protein 2 [Panicum hallii]|uniref:early nodulin-like protein 2 n=1 Tax=Panicum hallii TaxID=206008 RepID=UPI000DF4D2B1|nr:early nodulin-like protein 2 [Panicum hallii]
MRPCSGDVISLALALGFAVLVVAASAATSHNGVFYVGDEDGWVGKPAESYGRWAAHHRFKVTDTIVFKYKRGADSVLVVDKRHYDACDVRDPIGERSDGDSAYELGTAGPFYFISGDAGKC